MPELTVMSIGALSETLLKTTRLAGMDPDGGPALDDTAPVLLHLNQNVLSVTAVTSTAYEGRLCLILTGEPRSPGEALTTGKLETILAGAIDVPHLGAGRPVTLRAYSLIYGLTAAAARDWPGQPCLVLEGQTMPEAWEGTRTV